MFFYKSHSSVLFCLESRHCFTVSTPSEVGRQPTMADPVDEANKLPLEERLPHNLWKVRMKAYDDVVKVFESAEAPAE